MFSSCSFSYPLGLLCPPACNPLALSSPWLFFKIQLKPQLSKKDLANHPSPEDLFLLWDLWHSQVKTWLFWFIDVLDQKLFKGAPFACAPSYVLTTIWHHAGLMKPQEILFEQASAIESDNSYAWPNTQMLFLLFLPSFFSFIKHYWAHSYTHHSAKNQE